MKRPVSAFLDEVVEFIEDEVLPELYNSYRYFDMSQVRINYDDEQIKICNLSFCEKNSEEHVQRINDTLSRAYIKLKFQFHGRTVDGTWNEGLAQITVGMCDPVAETPTVLKWEGRDGEPGALKADEWFDPEREYIEESIDARDAIKKSVNEILHKVIPEYRNRSTIAQISPLEIQVMFDKESDILDKLQPTETEQF